MTGLNGKVNKSTIVYSKFSPMNGLMPGSVIFQKLAHGEAPSIRTAS